MFNLDDAIAEWRRQMLDAGINTPVPLDELEDHLRDDVQAQVRAGLSVQQAFAISARRIGEAHALKTEFAKAGDTTGAVRKLMVCSCAVLIGLIFLLSGFTFLQMQMGLGEQILAYAAVTFTLGAACSWRHAVPFLPMIPSKRKRMAIGSACILFGILCTSFFTNFVLPHFERNHDGQLPAIGFWAVFPIAVFSGLGLGLMMSAQDRERWGMKRASGRPATAV
jgi:hypothetical protein